MRILYIADARSAIAQNWIGHFVDRGHDVHVISSYLCSPSVIAGAKLYQFPIAFSQLARVNHNGTVGSQANGSPANRVLATLRTGGPSTLFRKMLPWLGSLEIGRHAEAARAQINQISPDIVHAMRIPFEGILGALATPQQIPLLVSVWGNDFTLFAKGYPLIARQTRQCLQRSQALHCDCQRDLKLARQTWSFPSDRPTMVLPGAGGIQTSMFHSGEPDPAVRRRLNIPNHAPVIINPRGLRAYVRNETFFQALPRVLREFPGAIFICTGMQGIPIVHKWLRRLDIEKSVRLLPSVPRSEMAELFRLATVTVSPSLHDGTPNTLLEAMACGCFPVAGDIESVREWITDGVNGLLCDPANADSLAQAMVQAITNESLRDKAREHNQHLVAERANYDTVMKRAEQFYLEVAHPLKAALTA
ncbi:MAG TPA: glycosyltransferase family 4 protein [Pyrinomonadaceae bacterium]|nr:glycosyltransferase family 4 protein [Pyrinomonadaceae bacterium]